jgi:hypothetical protein
MQNSRNYLQIEAPHLVQVSVSDMVLLNKDLIGRMNGSSYIGSNLSRFLLKLKEEELQKENQSIKILLYMVIHDLKHPAESLIAALKQTMQEMRLISD